MVKVLFVCTAKKGCEGQQAESILQKAETYPCCRLCMTISKKLLNGHTQNAGMMIDEGRVPTPPPSPTPLTIHPQGFFSLTFLFLLIFAFYMYFIVLLIHNWNACYTDGLCCLFCILREQAILYSLHCTSMSRH
jgi:hypothetical protein